MCDNQNSLYFRSTYKMYPVTKCIQPQNVTSHIIYPATKCNQPQKNVTSHIMYSATKCRNTGFNFAFYSFLCEKNNSSFLYSVSWWNTSIILYIKVKNGPGRTKFNDDRSYSNLLDSWGKIHKWVHFIIKAFYLTISKMFYRLVTKKLWAIFK